MRPRSLSAPVVLSPRKRSANAAALSGGTESTRVLFWALADMSSKKGTPVPGPQGTKRGPRPSKTPQADVCLDGPHPWGRLFVGRWGCFRRGQSRRRRSAQCGGGCPPPRRGPRPQGGLPGREGVAAAGGTAAALPSEGRGGLVPVSPRGLVTELAPCPSPGESAVPGQSRGSAIPGKNTPVSLRLAPCLLHRLDPA